MKMNLELKHTNVHTAYLQSKLTGDNDDIWVQLPYGFKSKSANVYGKLLRPMYGVRQAGRAFILDKDPLWKQSAVETKLYYAIDSAIQTLVFFLLCPNPLATLRICYESKVRGELQHNDRRRNFDPFTIAHHASTKFSDKTFETFSTICNYFLPIDNYFVIILSQQHQQCNYFVVFAILTGLFAFLTGLFAILTGRFAILTGQLAINEHDHYVLIHKATIHAQQHQQLKHPPHGHHRADRLRAHPQGHLPQAEPCSFNVSGVTISGVLTT
jgi:hypothetical protein